MRQEHFDKATLNAPSDEQNKSILETWISDVVDKLNYLFNNENEGSESEPKKEDFASAKDLKSQANTIDEQKKEIENQNKALEEQSNKIKSISDEMNEYWEKVYPVGSIYISANETSPASLFGGSWEQIKDVFLLSAGETYKAGSTGGEAEHTLTIDEIPTHNHEIEEMGMTSMGSGNSGYQTVSRPGQKKKTGDSGGGKSHNNMPPYLTVYMWKRTA